MLISLLRPRFLLTTLVATALTATAIESAVADTQTTGFLIVNPWLDDSSSGFPLDPPDGVGWTFNAPWEFEDSLINFLGAALLPTSSSNPIGVHAAEASTVDLTLQPNVTSLDGYDATTTRLTGLVFERPWRVGHFGTVPQNGEYELFMELTIDTPIGSYRASTNRLDRQTAFQNTIVQLPFTFSWEGGSFIGDPFAGGSGIPLAQITNIDYQLLVEVVSPTTGGTGFFNAEGFNVRYEVSSAATAASPGDFNGDGAIDAADYTVWRDNSGMPETALAPGSGDGSGAVGPGDYTLWTVNYGGAPSAVAVPEPLSVTGLGVSLLIVSVARRR